MCFPKAAESGGMTCVNEALSRYSPTRKERGRALTSTGQSSCPLCFPQRSPSTPQERRGGRRQEEPDGAREGEGKTGGSVKVCERERESRKRESRKRGELRKGRGEVASGSLQGARDTGEQWRVGARRRAEGRKSVGKGSGL